MAQLAAGDDGLNVLPGSVAPWLELALSTPVVWWAGWPFFVRGAKSVVSRHLNMFTLVSLGVGAAWLYSVVAVLAPTVLLCLIGARAYAGRPAAAATRSAASSAGRR